MGHVPIALYAPLCGESDIESVRRRTTQSEGEKACSSAREKQLYYITVSGFGSSHAFKEGAHVPLHLKSHGGVGEDRDKRRGGRVRRKVMRNKIMMSVER